MNLTPAEKITRAKVQLNRENPFFAYLVLHLKTKEFPPELKALLEAKGQLPTCAVDSEGTFYYSPEFIADKTDDECKSILSHEVSHLVFEHLIRKGNRDEDIFNISADLAVNNILMKNGFEANKRIYQLLPHNSSITLGKITLTDLDKKTAEMIYDELIGKIKIKKEKGVVFVVNGEGQGKDKKVSGDEHIFGEKENEEKQKEWQKRLVEAFVYSKNIGKSPAGMERFIDELLEKKMSWKQLLYRYITNSINSGYTWQRPSKKMQSCGIYLPKLKREALDVVVALDTSASISQAELTAFVTEMVAIARSFKNVRMTCLECDAEIQQVLEVTNGNIQKILDMKVKGGGGTDFTPVISWIEDNKPNAKILVYLTDGYGTLNKEPTTDAIWAITTNGTEENIKNRGMIVRMEE